MKRNLLVHSLALVAGLALTAACSGSSGNPASASSTSTPAAAASLNLAGNWSGKLLQVRSDGKTDTDGPLLSWTASQSGSAATGPFSLSSTDDDGRVVKLTGTLTGTISGAQVAFAMSFPTGSIAQAPACNINGTGTTAPTATSISATMAMTFSAPCVGTLVDHPTETDQMTLSKS